LREARYYSKHEQQAPHLLIILIMMKQQKKKLKGITPINLDVCPMRRFEKLFKYSSVR
jgi:hypothetical protein